MLPIWEQRNDIQHSKDSMYVKAIDRKLNEELRWYFRNKDALVPGDRFLLPREVNLVEKVNSKVKKIWIKRLDRFKAINEKERAETGKGQKKITRYFKNGNKGTERNEKAVAQEDRRCDRGKTIKQGRKKSGKEKGMF